MQKKLLIVLLAFLAIQTPLLAQSMTDSQLIQYVQKEMEKGLHRMLMFCMRIEHLTGKESIELTKRNG